MDVQAMQAAARAKLQQTDTFIDPTQVAPIPIIVQRVIPKVDRAPQAAYVLEAHQANFAIMLASGKKLAFVNYRFETEDAQVAEQIISQYAPRIWRIK